MHSKHEHWLIRYVGYEFVFFFPDEEDVSDALFLENSKNDFNRDE